MSTRDPLYRDLVSVLVGPKSRGLLADSNSQYDSECLGAVYGAKGRLSQLLRCVPLSQQDDRRRTHQWTHGQGHGRVPQTRSREVWLMGEWLWKARK